MIMSFQMELKDSIRNTFLKNYKWNDYQATNISKKLVKYWVFVNPHEVYIYV